LEYVTATIDYSSRIEKLTHQALSEFRSHGEFFAVSVEEAVNEINRQIEWWNKTAASPFSLKV
jgi:hypothetical protein